MRKIRAVLETAQEKDPNVYFLVFPKFCIIAIKRPNIEIAKYTKDGVHNSLRFFGNAIR